MGHIGVAPLSRTPYCYVKKESVMSRNHNSKAPYAPEFRQQIVELVASGRKPSELAKEFGCHVTSIATWVRLATTTPVHTPSPNAPLTPTERQELHELRRKLRQVQQERDILAKATAWFAHKSETTPTVSTS